MLAKKKSKKISDKKFIPLSVPKISGNEWKYIKECLDTEWVSSAGKYVEKFENEIRDLTGAKHAIACVNGTSALHVALKVADVCQNDEVIVPTLTFIAPVNAISYLNAYPVFMDCDDFYNIEAEEVINFIMQKTVFDKGYSRNRKTGRIIKAIIPVHIFGNAVNLEKLIKICKQRNISIIEDATESLGTYYTKGKFKDRHTGTIGDFGCYSFNGNKIITAGGGGMIVTNNSRYAKKAKYLTTQARDDALKYVHNEIGYNFRLTNIQAAMGVAQLEKLSSYIKIKKKNYMLYKKEIDKIPGLELAKTPLYANSNYWFYCLQVDEEKYNKTREQLVDIFLKNSIQVRPIWYLNHLQKPYKDCENHKIEKAFQMLKTTINIPCSTKLTQQEIARVINILKG